MIEENEILITGGTGLVGVALRKLIPNAKWFNSRQFNLTKQVDCEMLFDKYEPKYVIHLAAKVGGLGANINYMGDFYYDNITMNTNILEEAKNRNVKKVISLLSTCIYPDEVQYPLTEDQIHNSPPHYSNFGYAYAKRMLDIQSRAYRKQYGCNFVTLIPNNLYGIRDNFDLNSGHVIPSLIRKIYESKIENKEINLWGDGTPLREFTYSDDLAKIILLCLKRYNEEMPINVGNTIEISIKDLSHKICDLIGYSKDNIIWDAEKPNGQYRKPSSNKKLLKLGWKNENFTKLEDGLKKTIDWFLKEYPYIRGINE